MDTLQDRIGYAKRIEVKTPFGERLHAWDCRAFGFGRVVAPRWPTEIELGPQAVLDLVTGAVFASIRSRARGRGAVSRAA